MPAGSLPLFGERAGGIRPSISRSDNAASPSRKWGSRGCKELGVPPLDEILNAFDTAWSNETLGTDIQFCKEEDEQSLREPAEQMLAIDLPEYAALESTLPEPAQIISIEHSNRFRLLADVPPIESRIDLLELRGSKDTGLSAALKVLATGGTIRRLAKSALGQLAPMLRAFSATDARIGRNTDRDKVRRRYESRKSRSRKCSNHGQPQLILYRLKQTITETWGAINAGIFVKRESWARTPVDACTKAASIAVENQKLLGLNSPPDEFAQRRNAGDDTPGSLRDSARLADAEHSSVG